MEKFRVRAWLKAAPRRIVLDIHRCNKLGSVNLSKLMLLARKHKKSIHVITNPPFKKSQEIVMNEKTYKEYKNVIQALGLTVKVRKEDE